MHHLNLSSIMEILATGEDMSVAYTSFNASTHKLPNDVLICQESAYLGVW
jgi:hypothetical protein